MSENPWLKPLATLYSSRKPAFLGQLESIGIKTLEDILWLPPRKVSLIPPVQSFECIKVEEYFKGVAKVLNFSSKPNFYRKRSRGPLLYTAKMTVLDSLSSQTLTLQWFNCYPNVVKKYQSFDEVIFQGQVEEYKGKMQIVNPQIQERNHVEELESSPPEFLVTYPTINKIPTSVFTKIINKIPKDYWDLIPNPIIHFDETNKFALSLAQAFKILHAQIPPEDFSASLFNQALERLAYQEFFLEQIKIFYRRSHIIQKKAPVVDLAKETIEQLLASFPYTLTDDQSTVLAEVIHDLKQGCPMYRLIQGDVGCGKTTIASMSLAITALRGYQAALMCPTEALALQHYQNLKDFFRSFKIDCELYLGSTPLVHKRNLQARALQDSPLVVIGTHSLIQKDMDFKNLALAVIDEQHKFGVNQRIQLTSKGDGCHCLIMTATPIPRSLSLTQYGDLDISIIKSMPSQKKEAKTKIITPEHFEKFLSFLKTRLLMKEQAYIVVPAIEESQHIEMQNLENAVERFKVFFPEFNIGALHGKMKSEEKEIIFKNFMNHKIDLLVSTSVVEVGINNINSTIMAIMNPERFGLSSLHQMRGRVGRGGKPGFCFLVLDKKPNPKSLERLKIIEQSTDGFKIAEADLEIRGEGDLFGTNQSGYVYQRKVANIFKHHEQLQKARQDCQSLYNDLGSEIFDQFSYLLEDDKILLTI